MRLALQYVLSLPLIVFVLTAHAQRKPVLSKLPQWVIVNIDTPYDPALEAEAEDGYMDMVYERQTFVPEQSEFIRTKIKILTESGIQNASEISVSFDPQFQTLSFHYIKIIRDGQIIDKADISRMKVIQQEKDLRMHIYNGDLTALLFLEDVRKGDIIEYAYTLKGMNPVYAGKFSSLYSTGFRVPIGNLYYRLIIPQGKEVYIKNFKTDIRPEIADNIRGKVYEWKLHNLKPLHIEDNLPDWYDPFGTVMVSEFKTWEEVNAWALKLFTPVKALSAGLESKIEEINKTGKTDEEKVLMALRFVQDDIRYLGIEIGQSSHRPAPPDKIFQQRFGDCKDKSYLLCTMLNHMGIEAAPVLINSNEGALLKDDWLPMAKAFDHTTVRVKIGNEYYWFDPTISLQRGVINNIFYPNYGYGLVVQEGTTDLTSVKSKENGLVNVKEFFDITDSVRTILKVVTEYNGSAADDVRDDFNNSSRYELQKSYKNFYAGYFKDIIADSLTYHDNDSTGKFVTTEYYTITNIWDWKGTVKEIYFNPFVIDGLLRKPKEAHRTMPFRLPYPCHYFETIEISLPEEWYAQSTTRHINADYFYYKANFFYSNRKFTLRYEFQTLKDHVPAEDVPALIKQIDEERDSFSYQLSQDTSKIAKVNRINPVKSMIISIFIIAGTILGIGWLRKRLR
jgi:hypothetical protein